MKKGGGAVAGRTLSSQKTTESSEKGVDQTGWLSLVQGWLNDGPRSPNTLVIYRAAAKHFQSWCEEAGLYPFDLTSKQAGEFAVWLTVGGRAKMSTAQLQTRAVASLYSWVCRRKADITNPFRNYQNPIKLPPKRRRPLLREIELVHILETVSRTDAAMLAALAQLGIPIGSLSALAVQDGSFYTVFKGRKIEGPLPPGLTESMLAAGLDLTRPFSQWDSASIVKRLQKVLVRLAKKGQVEIPRSARDFLDFYAFRTYSAGNDLAGLSRRMGHASLLVTEKYLDRIGITHPNRRK